MSDKSEAGVIGSLPHSRPQRRSEKRGARARPKAPPEPKVEQPAPAPQAEEPAAATQAETPAHEEVRCASLPDGTELLATVVTATAELAEIGLTLGARALRTAVSRLFRR